MSAYDFLCDVRVRQREAFYKVHVRAVDEPATEIVTLAEAYLHCKIDTFEEGSPPETVSDEDSWLTDIGIPAAREYCESELWRSLAVRTMELTADAFPSTGIPLPFGPVQSIEYVTYIDQATADAAYDAAYTAAYDAEFLSSGDAELADAAGIAAGDAAAAAVLVQTMPDTDYQIDTTTAPMRLILAYGASWPSIPSRHAAVTVRYVVGYSEPEESPQVYVLPRLAKAAVLVMLTHLYDHRGDASIAVPVAVGNLLERIPGAERVHFA
jgi:hypothetical protein